MCLGTNSRLRKLFCTDTLGHLLGRYQGKATLLSTSPDRRRYGQWQTRNSRRRALPGEQPCGQWQTRKSRRRALLGEQSHQDRGRRYGESLGQGQTRKSRSWEPTTRSVCAHVLRASRSTGTHSRPDWRTSSWDLRSNSPDRGTLSIACRRALPEQRASSHHPQDR